MSHGYTQVLCSIRWIGQTNKDTYTYIYTIIYKKKSRQAHIAMCKVRTILILQQQIFLLVVFKKPIEHKQWDGEI